MSILADPEYLAWRAQAFPKPPAAEFAAPCDRHEGSLALTDLFWRDPEVWAVPHEVMQGEDVYVLHRPSRKRVIFTPGRGRQYSIRAAGGPLAASLGSFKTAEEAARFVEGDGAAKAKTPRPAR